MTNERSHNRKRITIARRIVQSLVLVLFIVAPLAGGLGLFGVGTPVDELQVTASDLPFFGSLSSSSIGGVEGVVLADPFAMLQVVLASKSFELSWLLAALPVLVVYGLIRGRAFCGWTCPVNFLLEGLDWVRSKLGLQVEERAVPRHVKTILAAVVLVLSALSGLLVFEVVSPISGLLKLVLFGSTTGLLTLAAIVVAELFWGHRIWCRSLCPLGGFYEALGKVGFVSVKMDAGKCVHCGACERACLCDPAILNGVLEQSKSRVEAGDCMVCGSCVDACPTQALSLGIASPFPTTSMATQEA